MSAASAIDTVLSADATLTGLLTGGIYKATDLARLEINRVDVPGAYDANGFMRPMALIKARDQVPSLLIPDAGERFMDTRQIVEIWLYNDGANGFTTIDSAANRIYTLLHEQRLEGLYRVKWANLIEHMRDPKMGLAAFNRIDFSVISFRGV